MKTQQQLKNVKEIDNKIGFAQLIGCSYKDILSVALLELQDRGVYQVIYTNTEKKNMCVMFIPSEEYKPITEVELLAGENYTLSIEDSFEGEEVITGVMRKKPRLAVFVPDSRELEMIMLLLDAHNNITHGFRGTTRLKKKEIEKWGCFHHEKPVFVQDDTGFSFKSPLVYRADKDQQALFAKGILK